MSAFFVYGEYTLCICGVEVLPMITFRPIDSGYLNVNIISRIVGTGLGDYDPLVQVVVRGGRYPSGRALLGIMTPIGHSVSPCGAYRSLHRRKE